MNKEMEKVLEHHLEWMLLMGIASGYLVVASIIVSRYL